MSMSLPLRVLRGLDGVSGLLRHPRPLDADALMGAAQRQARLDDFGVGGSGSAASGPIGKDAIREGLAALLEACEREARLSVFGRFSTRWDCLRLLVNLLILRSLEREDSTILARPIRQPIFITGLPRSGTSFLHALLAEDPAMSAPRCWQTIYPVRDHPAHGARSGPREVQRQFDVFDMLAPEMRSLHPFDALSPQECADITAHSFHSLRFDMTYEVPSYRRWLDQRGHEPAYREHKRFLQHLQGDQPAQWVLKCPDHVFALEALRAVYPDARLVFVHRDPVEVLPSVARLTEVVRTPFTRSVDRSAIGRQIADDWVQGANNIVAASNDRRWPRKTVHHVHYRALTADPLATAKALYDHFDLDLTPTAAARMRALVATKPKGGYGQNVYHAEDYRLDLSAERDRFQAYLAAFELDGRRLSAAA
jgi:hypothetical protein